MSTLNVHTSFNISLQFTSAPFHIRFFAWIIDFVIFILYKLGMGFLLLTLLGFDTYSSGMNILIYLPMFCYHLLFEILNHGQSLGKMTLGIRVVGADGREETNSQAMIRWLMRMIDFGGLLGVYWIAAYQAYFIGSFLIACNILAFILFLTTEYNQRLGDLAAGTVVVYKRLPFDLNDTIFRDLHTKNYAVQFPSVMKLSDNDINIIDNVLKRHRKSNIDNYLSSVAIKVKTALEIETDLEDDIFLEIMLNDYNYLSRK